MICLLVTTSLHRLGSLMCGDEDAFIVKDEFGILDDPTDTGDVTPVWTDLQLEEMQEFDCK